MSSSSDADKQAAPPAKRPRLNNGSESTSRTQVDAHVREFLVKILQSKQRSSPSATNGTNKDTVIRRKPAKEKRDVGTQTDPIEEEDDDEFEDEEEWADGDLYDPNEYWYDNNGSDSAGFVPNQSQYSEETLRQMSVMTAQHEDHSLPQASFDDWQQDPSAGKLNSNQVKEEFDRWAKDYEKWFKDTFGADVRGMETPGPQQQEEQRRRLAALRTDQPPPPPSPMYIPPPPPEQTYVPPSAQTYLPPTNVFTSTAASLPFSVPMSSAPCFSFPMCTGTTTIPTSIMLSTAVTSSTPVFLRPLLSHAAMPFLRPTLPIRPPMLVRLPMPSIILRPASPMPPPMMAPRNRAPKAFVGPWGPLLRYGTYGIFHSSVKKISEEQNESSSDNSEQDKEILKKTTDTSVGPDKPPVNKDKLVSMRRSGDNTTDNWVPPPQPPPYIFFPKQSMICALQVPLRNKAHDLLLRERDSQLRYSINYTSALREVVQQGVGLPVLYLYTRVGKLPPLERAYFLGESTVAEGDGVDTDVDLPGPEVVRGVGALKRMYLCDLLIGDVLVAQSMADWKRRAREAAARQAFQVLSKPAFVLGSTRLWYHTDYMVLCVSDDQKRVPCLPPFLSDPTEPLWKKDRYINEASITENFHVVNPMPLDELWLYEGMGHERDHVPEVMLARSAEFCQMILSFEVDVLRDGTFEATALIDAELGPKAKSRDLLEARETAAGQLLRQLERTAPVVSLRDGAAEASEEALVDSLMWGKQERDAAIPLQDLGQHIDLLPRPATPPSSSSEATVSEDGNANVSEEPAMGKNKQLCEAEYLMQCYAEAALITPQLVTSEVLPKPLWPELGTAATGMGLMTQRRPNGELLVCKRVPLPRIKKTLLEVGSFGVFCLKHPGNLSQETLARLEGVMPVLDSDDQEGGGVRDDSSNVLPVEDANLTLVKDEPFDDDCIVITAELNSRFNPIEILDDLPKQRIPGLDF